MALKTGLAKNAENLLNDPLAGDPFSCQTDRQAEHGDSSIQLFSKNLGGIRSVGHWKEADATNVKRCEDHLACHFLHHLFGISKWCASAKVGGEPGKAQAPKIIAEAAIKNASDSDAALQL